MALEKELETYRRELPQLLDCQGKFVVIGGEEVAGVWDTYPDALQAGYERYRLNPFMVKRIETVEEAQFITKEIVLWQR